MANEYRLLEWMVNTALSRYLDGNDERVRCSSPWIRYGQTAQPRLSSITGPFHLIERLLEADSEET
jgi:hypothetical protein